MGGIAGLIARTVLRGAVYRLLPRGKSGVLMLALVAIIVLAVAQGARAATYGAECAPADDPITDTQAQCLALVERLELLVELEEAAAVELATSGEALVDVRTGVGHLLGFGASCLFAVAFWRTFGRSSGG